MKQERSAGDRRQGGRRKADFPGQKNARFADRRTSAIVHRLSLIRGRWCGGYHLVLAPYRLTHAMPKNGFVRISWNGPLCPLGQLIYPRDN